MTYTGATISGVVALLFWYIGWKMYKRIHQSKIEIKDIQIKGLEWEVKRSAAQITKMFYRYELRDAYIAGSRCNKPQQSFEVWLEETYKDVEPVEEEAMINKMLKAAAGKKHIKTIKI